MELIPNCCIDINNEEMCKITGNGVFLRSRVFKENFPFYLEIPKYYCQIHNNSFNLITFTKFYVSKLPKIVSVIGNEINPIIIFDKTILVIYINRVYTLTIFIVN